MSRNVDEDYQLYKIKITEHLVAKHNLSKNEAEELLTSYDMAGFAKKNPQYFYYESSQCWAEYLISPPPL